MNYTKLMSANPFHYETMTNSVGQVIDFYEHPNYGDSAPVIVVCHDLQTAILSEFYELDDMTASHGEYEPI